MPKMLLYEAKISDRKLSWVKDCLEKQETGGIWLRVGDEKGKEGVVKMRHARVNTAISHIAAKTEKAEGHITAKDWIHLVFTNQKIYNELSGLQDNMLTF